MPTSSTPILTEAGLTLPGNYDETSPGGGLEETLQLFAYAEELGYQVAGVRQRHLERGLSSALPFLAAATQRTSTIRLETAVVPLGFETPFRLAEDFATVDVLSRGRVNVGVSSSAPHRDVLRALGRVDEGDDIAPYTLIERFLEALEGRALSDEIATPYGPQIPRIQPHVPSLRERVWLGGGSSRSVRWAAEHGLKLFLGNLAAADGDAAFEEVQRARIDEYYAVFAGAGEPAVGVERVIVPTDSATSAQRQHYAAFAASREERTLAPTRGLVFQKDLVGTTDEILDRLRADPAIDGRTQLRVAVPYAFHRDEYRQILSDIAGGVLPHLGWKPAGAAVAVAA